VVDFNIKKRPKKNAIVAKTLLTIAKTLFVLQKHCAIHRQIFEIDASNVASCKLLLQKF